MDTTGIISFEGAPNDSCKDILLGPKYARSISLSDIPITISSERLIILCKEDYVNTGRFIFDPKNEDGVITHGKEFGRFVKTFALEKVNTEKEGDSNIKVSPEFYPLLHRMLTQRLNWGVDFDFRGRASYRPKLIEWTDLILRDYREILKAAGIYGAVAVSCYPYHYEADVWKAFLELWGPLSNTFHHGGGELGISLYDLKTIGGLPITGHYYEEFIPTNEILCSTKDGNRCYHLELVRELLMVHAQLCDYYKCNVVSVARWQDHFFRGDLIYEAFGEDNTPLSRNAQLFPAEKKERGKKPDLQVSHKGALAAYLAFWLSRFVLPYGELKTAVVRPEVFLMASLMANGTRVSLAPTVLGYIYNALGKVSTHPVSPGRANPIFPIHYVIGWLGEYFPSLYHCRKDDEFDESYPRLIRYAGVKGQQKTLYEARLIFRRDKYICFRPSCFLEKKGSNYYDNENLSEGRFEYLVNLRSTVLPVRIGSTLILEPYYPNRFARQFGFDQGVPTNKLSFMVNERSQRSLKDLAEARALLLRRNTGVYFYIPHMGNFGSCTYWYCRWWGRTVSSYLGKSINKVHTTLTRKPCENKEATFVINNMRTFVPNLKGRIKGGSLQSRNQAETSSSGRKNHKGSKNNSQGGILVSGSSRKRGATCNPKVKTGNNTEVDRDYKRSRYNKASSESDDSCHNKAREVTDLTVDEIHTVVDLDHTHSDGLNALPTNDVLPEKLPSLSITPQFDLPFVLKNFVVLTDVDGEVDEITTNFIKSLVCKLVNFLPTSTSPEALLEQRPKIMKTLDMIKNVTLGTDGLLQDGFEWLNSTVGKLFQMSETIIAEDNAIKEGQAVDVARIAGLSDELSIWLTKKESLNLELQQLLVKSDEFIRREDEIRRQEELLKEMKMQLENDKILVEEQTKKLNASLQDGSDKESELQKSLLDAGNERLQNLDSQKNEFLKHLSTLNYFVKSG